MRTTLTLDDDVAALLDRAVKRRRTGLKVVVNEALRTGLRRMMEPKKAASQFRTKPRSLGRCLVGSLDNVAEVLALAESDRFK